MNRSKIGITLLIPLLGAIAAGILLVSAKDAKPAADSADFVLTNGAIYTVNSKQPWAEAVAVMITKPGKVLC